MINADIVIPESDPAVGMIFKQTIDRGWKTRDIAGILVDEREVQLISCEITAFSGDYIIYRVRSVLATMNPKPGTVGRVLKGDRLSMHRYDWFNLRSEGRLERIPS